MMPALSSEWPPPEYLLGGLRISHDTAVKWASRLQGREMDPATEFDGIQLAIQKVIPSPLEIMVVGEDIGVHWMIVTQSAECEGSTDMDPSLIPQFEVGEKEAIAQKVLEDAGITEYEFITVAY